MEFKWNLDIQEIIISCDNKTIILKDNGDIVFNSFNVNKIISINDIGGINIIAPKLLSKGVIGILDKDKKLMKVDELLSISCAIVKKQEKQFNQFVSIMKDNGIDVRVVG